MKHFTLLVPALLLSVMLQAQLFESSFEDWTGSTPDEWVGSKTNLPGSGIEQVTDNVHSGTSAVRLIRAVSGHQRFTTQPLSVVDGTTYTVSFWVRGEGQIRVGLFDERATNSGYAGYVPQNYVTVSGNTWQQVSQQIVAANTSAVAEFILSLQNTVAPNHLVVDDVTITEGGVVNPPQAATITEIQQTTDPGGASTLVGTVVSTSGIVTALVPGNNPGYFIQSGSGAWSGIYVFSPPGSLAIGDAITLNGTVAEFNGQTQLTFVSNVFTASSGNAIPTTVITTAEANTEPYESVLVTVQNAAVTAAGQFGQYTINDGSGPTLVDDVIYAHPFTVGTVYSITGVLQYAFSEWRILPRFTADVSITTGMAQLDGSRVRMYPNPASDLLQLETGLEGRVEVQLTDAAGRTVLADVLTSDRSQLNVASLPNGLYLLTLRSAAGSWSSRVMVAR
jgi:hypothetical protein